jgi:hypothetical protein
MVLFISRQKLNKFAKKVQRTNQRSKLELTKNVVDIKRVESILKLKFAI